MHSFGFRFLSLISLLGGFAFALPKTLGDLNVMGSSTIQTARSANTCADPTLTRPLYQAFLPSGVAHVLNFRWVIENFNTVNKAILEGDLHPLCNAWSSPQNFTVPLFQLSSTDGTQFISKIGADVNTPPVVSGFVTNGIIGWVYSTQVCGSVPLMSVSLGGAFTDHYATTDQLEHDGLIADGWADAGVIAFVLPLNTS